MGSSHNAHRKYSSKVDFPVPRPPIMALYWQLNSRFMGPKKELLETLMLVIKIEGSRAHLVKSLTHGPGKPV